MIRIVITIIIISILCHSLLETYNNFIKTHNYYDRNTMNNIKDNIEPSFDYSIDDNNKFNNIWSDIVYDKETNKPSQYHIHIPNLQIQQFMIWKKIIPNIDFDIQHKILIISSYDEVFALIIANFIIMTSLNQITCEEIIKKKLIPKTIRKAKKHDLVLIKIQDHIKDNLYGNKIIQSNIDFKFDLSNLNKTNSYISSNDTETTSTDVNISPQNNTIFNVTSRDRNDCKNYNLHTELQIQPFDNSNYASIE